MSICSLLFSSKDKNHNPRKGTETPTFYDVMRHVLSDKNHNPRKGTETAIQILECS